MGETVEVVLHTLDYHHGLAVAVCGKSHVLKCLGGNLHFGHLTNFGEQRVVGRSCLALHGDNLQLRVDISEERCHKIVETIEHTECNHQCHGGYGNAHGTYAAYDVDGMRTLLGEEVAAGYEKRKVQLKIPNS